MKGHILAGLYFVVVPSMSTFAQNNPDASSAHGDRLSKTPFGSSRHDSTAGAMTTFADGTDAALSNPAGVGGYGESGAATTGLRQLHFPYVYNSSTPRSSALASETAQGGSLNAENLLALVNDTDSTEPSYGRFSVFPNIGTSSFLFGPLYDVELDTRRSELDVTAVDVAYQKRLGAAAGFSIGDPEGILHLGVFAHYSKLDRFVTTFQPDQLTDLQTARQSLQDNSLTFTGTSVSAGASWRIAKKHRPVVSIAVMDAGGTRYSQADAAEDAFEVKENVKIGFGASPSLFKTVLTNFVVEAAELTDHEMIFKHKWRIASAITYGGAGALAPVGLTAGLSSLGASYGGHLNIGLIGLQYANFASNVGVDDQIVIERRQSATVSINLAQ